MDGVEVTLIVPGGEAASALIAFKDWLCNEEKFRGGFELARAPFAPGRMGGTLSHLLVEIPDRSVAGALAFALWQWLRHRRTSVKARITGPGDRVEEIDVQGLTQEQLERILPELTERIWRASRGE